MLQKNYMMQFCYISQGFSLRKISFVPFKMRLRLRLLHFSLCSLQTSRNEWKTVVGEKACKQARPRILYTHYLQEI